MKALLKHFLYALWTKASTTISNFYYDERITEWLRWVIIFFQKKASPHRASSSPFLKIRRGNC